jgi:hypothetical protein
MSLRSFLDRFVHPWVAAVALVGVGIWLLAFVVAAAGLVIRYVGTDLLLAFQLFFTSGIVGLIGMAVLSVCGLYLVGVRTKQLLTAA